MAEARDTATHQAGDISLKGIGTGLGVILGGIAIAVGVPWIVIVLSRVPPNAPNDAMQPKTAAPVQRLAPTEDMKALRREKIRRLESYGVDPRTGDAHIPIERAMQLLVQGAKVGEKR